MTDRAYQIFMVLGVILGIRFWMKLGKKDERLIVIYVASLAGAFIGAKLAYFLAEGFRDIGQPDMWQRLATGKSILGGLLGGYASVEIAKKYLDYTGVTGDWFASLVPFTILLGRLGCWFHGCCLGRICQPSWFTVNDRSGQARWPSVPIEISFNAVAIGAFWWLKKNDKLKGQHFHLYLISYGAFRFTHEFFRDTPRVMFGVFSGYQMISLLLLIVGAVAYQIRSNRQFNSTVVCPLTSDPAASP